MNITFEKHLIECHCILPLFKDKSGESVYHKFPVYSKIDENGKIIEKIVQCNNCGVIHKVLDVCKSEILSGKDENLSMISISDIEFQLSERLANLLKQNNCDITVWEHVLDVIEEERWGEHVVLSRQIIESDEHVKVIIINSESKFKIENHKIYTDIFREEEI